MKPYEHTQIGHVIIWPLLLAIILVAIGGLAGSSSHPETALVLSIILLVSLVLFYKLTIILENGTLCASFGIGLIRKQVPLAESCPMRANSHSVVVTAGEYT